MRALWGRARGGHGPRGLGAGHGAGGDAPPRNCDGPGHRTGAIENDRSPPRGGSDLSEGSGRDGRVHRGNHGQAAAGGGPDRERGVAGAGLERDRVEVERDGLGIAGDADLEVVFTGGDGQVLADALG